MQKNIKKLLIGTTMVATLFSSTVNYTFANQIHTVKSGDTLWKISQQYNTNLNEIYRLNPQYQTTPALMVGSIITIPSTGQTNQPTYTNYTVTKNDTPWIISNRFGVSLNELLRINGMTASSHIYPGQVILIPSKSTITPEVNKYTVVKGDTPWIISQKFNVNLQQLMQQNNLKEGQSIYIGQILSIPKGTSITPDNTGSTVPPASGVNTKTTTTHIVASGDDLWSISIKYGIPFPELKQVNGLTDRSVLRVGQKLTIPVYHIAVKPTPGPQYGELLDWWTEAQYVVPIGKVFTMYDVKTGKRWQAKRTIGANHADCEPLTAKDAAIMKGVWGGSYSWTRRVIIVEVDGRRLAASATSTPHDIQYIKDNNYNGHFDVYFLNGTRHKDGQPDPAHQSNVLEAGGK
ncbi:LysM peptidoglycan-binding domain-containing protein [Alkaliphilus hydrothermalis]|uniref:LysM repeat protein n=1 Tax=Alkaliphilus hydrothermalis TaxID=1482730 RepID=A0ABS2NMS3_9FIRM|nr:LysM peptidoglycan-binding domain-containing protein [Alkaliphilus hydrothermalis]MBM7614250.1 LysM repeat protein [Alkaliphilus hydrothermalis]